MEKSCCSCINKYPSLYSRWCTIRNIKVKENICEKYDDELDLNDLVEDIGIYECEGHIEKEHLKQAIDNLIDELQFAIMQYPEQRDYLIKKTIESIESEFKEEKKNE
ncbi:hypothetical protein [Clostridium perfringens]|uniref:hypothetical protein n=1 Tax=Clostridium perfringens TaxID=1502 RepID=UPI000991BB20|nr:hypothetical protein [Clostridium perfringens]AQW23472.1 hypothetical protein BXT91_05980 [Clostridium perfringens]ATD48946.1 hypothetical protein CMR01_09185 [Clostridium perfringens]